jgi:ADP-ribosylglycohydrolase
MSIRLPETFAERARGAMVAAAVGDALGWPQETRSNIVGGQKARNVQPEARFRRWERNSGRQYARYREAVEAGEYSDDTQLLMVVARCCLAGEQWLPRLTGVELPAWTLYQRGAGRAVIAAGRSWADGYPPWTDSNSRDRHRTDPVVVYFNAGANGAAMRVAPHAIVTAGTDSDELIARVVADSITTHGHPRAFVGAVIHALAMRHALLRQGTMDYGDLVTTLLEDPSWQDAQRFEGTLPRDWLLAFTKTTGHSFVGSWQTTVYEVTELLRIADKSLRLAALANDENTLSALGCFDKTRNGAGTVTSVAAAYIATRAAARPMTGLLRAAFLSRADTDTLASMTASLLGAIHGSKWLGGLGETVQDSEYLHDLGTRLAGATLKPIGQYTLFNTLPSDSGRVRRKEIEGFRGSLFDLDRLPTGRFPDGRNFAVDQIIQLAKTGQTEVTRLRLRTEDHQTLILDRVTRSSPNGVLQYDTGQPRRGVGHDSLGLNQSADSNVTEITLRVSDVARSWEFYRDVLRLNAERISSQSFRLPNGLILSERPHRSEHGWHPEGSRDILITIEVKNFDDVASRVQSSGLAEIISIERRRGNPQLRVRDPDGNDLKIVPQ